MALVQPGAPSPSVDGGPYLAQQQEVTIAGALELTALVARKQPQRYGRFAARWLCLYLEEHEKATLEDVVLLVSKLRSLATPKDHATALAILRNAARRRVSRCRAVP